MLLFIAQAGVCCPPKAEQCEKTTNLNINVRIKPTEPSDRASVFFFLDELLVAEKGDIRDLITVTRASVFRVAFLLLVHGTVR